MNFVSHQSSRQSPVKDRKYWLMALIATLLLGCVNNAPNPETQANLATSTVQYEQWQTVSLGGHKMGYRHILTEAIKPTLINTNKTLSVTLSQPGVANRDITTTLSYQESASGKPISLSKTVQSNNTNHHLRANIKGNTLTLNTKNSSQKEHYTIPQPFYLPEGLRLALLSHSDNVKPFEYFSWNFSTRQFDKIQLTIKPYSNPEQPEYVWHIQQKTIQGDSIKHSEIFSDAQFHALTERSFSNGDEVLIRSCDKACATASFNPNTHVYRQLIRSPYKITDTALHGKIRYLLDGNFTLKIPNTYEQRSSIKDQGTELVICEDCGNEEKPSQSDLNTALEDNYWLPAKNPLFQSLVTEILPDHNSSAAGKMRRLTRFVTRHMSEEPSYSGYSTALEAYNSKKGDCTEHALLLATLARAAQIPTRVVFGLAYSNERFLGRKYVFVPHAWVQAWTGERWESYDSGLGEFTAGYIALGLSDGDQKDILKINEQLHNINIKSAIQIRSR
ncbi:Uncharacterised protein [Zhongshania aliphaticivorans]|uniref:Transglutaminase-like domain-containing protein n=1 Tax=Zhongshania aliphaticivorans TaxID=1470434 RepID=A0A5S9N4I0_9GAMM|nr:transglutaminase-like domain-containing protein [Zhongshania aliphaticivorans]CAA0082295.1 Uncharacterised protein [Zhongshania aliphaticivorans]CAA0084427.1 Uncharacterised protein [Zhongshania aliphaticivorans]